MDEKLKKALECCINSKCNMCPLYPELYCDEILTAEAEKYITELEERLAITQENMEWLEKRCEALEASEAPKEQEWNVLTEDADGFIHGLPGDDGQYLMTDGKDIWIDDYVDGVADGIILDSGRDIREIKAWMYMPELPKTDRR